MRGRSWQDFSSVFVKDEVSLALEEVRRILPPPRGRVGMARGEYGERGIRLDLEAALDLELARQQRSDQGEPPFRAGENATGQK